MKRVLLNALVFAVASTTENLSTTQSADEVVVRYTKAQRKNAVQRVTIPVFTEPAVGKG